MLQCALMGVVLEGIRGVSGGISGVGVSVVFLHGVGGSFRLVGFLYVI